MNAEVKEMIAACETCREYERSQSNQPLMPLEIPSRPLERIGVDLFTFDNKEFLITVDYFSNFWEIDKLNNTLASTVILRLKSHFARDGYPDQVVSDNGPQFDCRQEFRKFAEAWDFENTPSSPGNSKLKPTEMQSQQLRLQGVFYVKHSTAAKIPTGQSLTIGTHQPKEWTQARYKGL